jgi:hypothetical protein
MNINGRLLLLAAAIGLFVRVWNTVPPSARSSTTARAYLTTGYLEKSAADYRCAPDFTETEFDSLVADDMPILPTFGPAFVEEAPPAAFGFADDCSFNPCISQQPIQIEQEPPVQSARPDPPVLPTPA